MRHANQAGAKFCVECGSRLSSVCPACGAPNQPGAKFWAECGTRLAADGGQAAATAPTVTTRPVPGIASGGTERRVSVLFAGAYREAWGSLRELRLELELAQTMLDVLVVAPSDVEGRSGIEREAREVLERIGARAYLRQLDELTKPVAASAAHPTSATEPVALATEAG
jgi:hypothetical protein